MNAAEDRPRFTRQERGLSRRVANRLLTIEFRDFPSKSNPDKSYRARVEVGGKVLCNCQGWTIKKAGQPRRCRHTDELIGKRTTRSDGEYLYLITETTDERE